MHNYSTGILQNSKLNDMKPVSGMLDLYYGPHKSPIMTSMQLKYRRHKTIHPDNKHKGIEKSKKECLGRRDKIRTMLKN